MPLTAKLMVESELVIPTTDAGYQAFLTALERLRTSIPLVTLLFKEQPAGSQIYRYELTTADSRQWIQTIQFDVTPNDPAQTFDVTSLWKLSEFTLNRPVRDGMIYLRNTYGVTKITGDWTW